MYTIVNNRILNLKLIKMGEIVTTRVDKDLAKDVDFIAKKEKVDRSTITRKLLAKAIEEKKLEYALLRYKNNEITLGKAAKLAGKGLREMMIIASKKDIPFQYAKKDLREDFEAAIK